MRKQDVVGFYLMSLIKGINPAIKFNPNLTEYEFSCENGSLMELKRLVELLLIVVNQE